MTYVYLTRLIQFRTLVHSFREKRKKTAKIKTDMLRGIGKQSGKSAESVLKKKNKAIRREGFVERESSVDVMWTNLKFHSIIRMTVSTIVCVCFLLHNIRHELHCVAIKYTQAHVIRALQAYVIIRHSSQYGTMRVDISDFF